MSAILRHMSAPGEAGHRRVLGLVGLGMRGRLVVVGAEQVRLAAHKGVLQLALVANDVSRHTLEKVVLTLQARHVAIVEWPSAAELGGAVGRETTAAIGIVDLALARGIRDVLAGRHLVGDSTRVPR